jgi:hypothetical protein
MPTWEARYVRVADRSKDIPRLRELVSRMHPGAQLVEVGEAPFAAWLTGETSEALEAPDLSEMSREYGEAIGIAAHTVADLVLYDHFVAGDRVRGLTYAGEAGWVRVIGDPESWEARALFSQNKLEELKSQLEEELTGDALARDAVELERLWTVGRLEEGSTRPPVEPVALARALEKHFSLPPRPRK